MQEYLLRQAYKSLGYGILVQAGLSFPQRVVFVLKTVCSVLQ